MELTGYLAAARRWWFLLLAAVVVAAVGGYGIAAQLPKTYEAEVRILVGPLNTDIETQRAAGQITNTYAQLVTSAQITDAVITRLGLTMGSPALQESIGAVPNDLTRLVTIRVQNGDPELAAALANAIAEELRILGAAVDRPEGGVTVVDPAEAQPEPIAPQVSLIVLLAAFGGLLVAVSGIVVLEYLRDAVTSEAELRSLSGAPILGRLVTKLDRRRDLSEAILSPEPGERYRAMTGRIERSISTGALRTVLITGARADGSADVLAAGLALAFADRGISTGLVPDAVTAQALKPAAFPGSTPAGAARMRRITFTSGEKRGGERRTVQLTVMPRGTDRDFATSKGVSTGLDRLRANADLVVIAAPPIDRSLEGLLWAAHVDAIVMSVPFPGVRRAEVDASVEVLRQAGFNLAGTILTESSRGERKVQWRSVDSQPVGFDQPRGADPVVQPRAADRVAQPRAANPVVQPQAANPVVQPQAANPAVQPRTTRPVTNHRAANLVAEPQAADPVAEPQAADPVAEPQAAEPVAEPQAADPVAQPRVDQPASEPLGVDPVPAPTPVRSPGGRARKAAPK